VPEKLFFSPQAKGGYTDVASLLCRVVDEVLGRWSQHPEHLTLGKRPLFFLEDSPALFESEDVRRRLNGYVVGIV